MGSLIQLMFVTSISEERGREINQKTGISKVIGGFPHLNFSTPERKGRVEEARRDFGV